MSLATCIDCGKEVSTSAPSCPHCGRPFSDSSTEPRPRTDLAWALIGAPLAGAVLLLVWVGNAVPIIFVERDTTLIVAGVVIITAVLAAIEVSNTANRSAYDSGPASWFAAVLLIWFIAYPLYMFKRKRYGLQSNFAAGLVVTLIFLGCILILGAAIYDQELKVREALTGTQQQNEAGPQAQSARPLVMPEDKIARHIRKQCKSIAGESYALQSACEEQEFAAWRRINVDVEFDDLDSKIRKYCTAEPFDTYALVESCVQQELTAKGVLQENR